MPIFCEVTAANATKGEAVQQVAELCEISDAHIYVAGDSANDLSMMQKFYSFAPENGEGCALNAANEIVCDNNCGAIAEIVKALANKYPE